MAELGGISALVALRVSPVIHLMMPSTVLSVRSTQPSTSPLLSRMEQFSPALPIVARCRSSEVRTFELDDVGQLRGLATPYPVPVVLVVVVRVGPAVNHVTIAIAAGQGEEAASATGAEQSVLPNPVVRLVDEVGPAGLGFGNKGRPEKVPFGGIRDNESTGGPGSPLGRRASSRTPRSAPTNRGGRCCERTS